MRAETQKERRKCDLSHTPYVSSKGCSCLTAVALPVAACVDSLSLWLNLLIALNVPSHFTFLASLGSTWGLSRDFGLHTSSGDAAGLQTLLQITRLLGSSSEVWVDASVTSQLSNSACLNNQHPVDETKAC